MRKLFTVLLVLFPFLNQFGLPVDVPILTVHFSIGYLVLIPFALLVCMYKIPIEGLSRIKVYGFSGFYLFLLAAAFSSVRAQGKFYYSGNSKLLQVGVMITFWLVVLYAAREVFNVRFGMKIYAWLAVFFSLYFILQLLVFRFNGYHLPTIFRESYVYGRSYVDAFRVNDVPTSFFTSTYAFSLFCLPAVAYLLLWDRIGFNGGEFISALIISGALCFTKIPQIIVALFLLWGLYFLFIFVYFVVHPYDGIYRFVHQNPARIVLQLVSPLVVVAGMVLYLSRFGRITRLLADVKAMIRDPANISGFTSASKMNEHGGFLRLFGCGVGNVEKFLNAVRVPLPAGMNSAGYVFLSMGIIGLVLYVGSLFGLLATRRGKFGFAIALLSVCAAVFANIVFLDISIFWVMLALCANDNEEMTFRKFLRIRR